jgi:non-heme chloroperoxidase
MANEKTPVVFIHGLWLHSSSWQPWINRFNEAGYEASSLDWPGDAHTVKLARENPQSVADKGLDEIVEFHAQQIRRLGTKPVIIGHSFGGLIAERLAGIGLALATIALDPAPMKGVYILPLSALRVASIALRNPENRSRAVMLTQDEFRYGFGNAISPVESKQLFERWANRSSYKIENKSQGEVTDLHVFEDRGHSLTVDSGWQEVADYSLNWLKQQSLWVDVDR